VASDGDPPRWVARTVALQAKHRGLGSVFDGATPRFDEQAELGRGGMGRVAQAHDRALDRTVAIKHMLATDGAGLARFEREVRITARLQHPGIVPVLDAGRDADGQPYYVMYKIDGVPLHDRAARRPVRDRLALLPAMLAAVDAAAYAHAQGIVHRDIKPGNILLGPFGEALLIDWGLARDLAATDDDPVAPGAAAPGLTRTGAAYGTPGYMAPEQARGQPADRRADVYSLGATLFFMLTGSPPIAGAEPTKVIERTAAGERPALWRIPPEVPVELVAIVAKALAAEREQRYGDAGELGADLRRFLAGQLVAAHRYTVVQHILRWVRRHRLATGAIAALLVGGALAITRIVAERDRAREARALAEARAEELLVDRARSLVDVDPTSAIAALRGLPPGSPRWPVAREVVRAAVAGGVARRVGRHQNRITAIAYSPGGRLASASARNSLGTGGVQLHDLVRGSSTTVSTTGANQLGWLDDRVLAATASDGSGGTTVRLIDTDTERTTPLPTAARDLAVADGRVVILSATGAVVAYDADARPTALADAGVATIDARAGRIAMLSRDRLVILDRDGTRHERTVAIPVRLYRVRLSATGARVAAMALDTIFEWVADGDQPPRTWPRDKRAASQLAYAGEQLYTWSNDGTGLSACEADRTVTVWLTNPSGDIGLVPTEAGEAAVFATPEGRLAHSGAAGLVELPHRREAVSRIALDPSGRRLAVGTDDGELELVDLASALPELHAIASDATLRAISGNRMLVGPEAGGSHDIAALDGEGRHPLDLGIQPVAWFDDDSVVAISGPGNARTLVITDLEGRIRYRAERIGSAAFRRDVTFATTAGDIIQVPPRDVARARVLDRFEREPIALLDQTAAGVVVVTNGPGDTWPTYLIDDAGRHPLPLGGDGMPSAFQRTTDGAWWFIVDYVLWRRPQDGIAAPVPLEHRVHWLLAIEDRVIASGPTTIYALANDGRVEHATPTVGNEASFDDGLVLSDPAGVVVAMPIANVRRTLRIAAKATRLRSTPDARTVAALVTAPDRRRFVAIWRDPVPVDPAELPAYIERLTNARIDSWSGELRWDSAPADRR